MAILPYSLELDKNGNFRRLTLISFLGLDERAFYKHPMRGSCKLDLFTSGHYQT